MIHVGHGYMHLDGSMCGERTLRMLSVASLPLACLLGRHSSRPPAKHVGMGEISRRACSTRPCPRRCGRPRGDASRNCGTRPRGDADSRHPGHRAGRQQPDCPIGGRSGRSPLRASMHKIRSAARVGPSPGAANYANLSVDNRARTRPIRCGRLSVLTGADPEGRRSGLGVGSIMLGAQPRGRSRRRQARQGTLIAKAPELGVFSDGLRERAPSLRPTTWQWPYGCHPGGTRRCLRFPRSRHPRLRRGGRIPSSTSSSAWRTRSGGGLRAPPAGRRQRSPSICHNLAPVAPYRPAKQFWGRK
jgi:hypothetical protein